MVYLILVLSLFFVTPCWSATKYVSSDGDATWINCTSAETPCSMTTANSNADDDDVVILADGTYTTPIYPSNSGSAGHMIIYQAANKWGAIIGNAGAITNRNQGVWIAQDYIKVDGIKVDGALFMAAGPNNLMLINQGADHVEITNCWFTGAAYMQTYSSTHIWFHGNLVSNNSALEVGESSCNDITYGMQLGSTGTNYYGVDGYNTVEDNTFAYGGHHNLETFTYYNVIRNNFFYNEGNIADPGVCAPNPDSNGKYGNRNIQVYDHAGSDGEYTLLEGNRFGPSGAPADDSGWGGEGMTITSPKNIIRHNTVYSAMDGGVMFKTGANALSDNNRFYNNTVTGSGRYNPGNYTVWPGANFTWYGTYERTGNVIKNNIFYAYGEGGADWYGGSANIYEVNTVTNNLCTDTEAGRCSATGDPLFVDGSLPAITSTPTTTDPNLALQSGSPAINGGTSLTLANGAGDSNATLHVDDALYFQDGTWGSSLSNIQADWIAIGTVTNVVQISSIDYQTNTITLASPMTWADDAPIWLYKKSDGEVVLYGSAPDYGAHEYQDTSPTTSTSHASGSFNLR